jgi:hypothetical protein
VEDSSPFYKKAGDRVLRIPPTAVGGWFKSFLKTMWLERLTRLPMDPESAIQVHWQARRVFMLSLEPAMKKKFDALANET